MHSKGQVEFIVIVGILIVVAVVAVMMLQTGSIGPATTPDQRSVKESVEGFIRTAAYDTMAAVGKNGGYIEPAASTVSFLGNDVAYWQRNGQLSVPDVTTNMVSGIQEYLNENKGSLEQALSDKKVSLGNAQVTARMLPNQIELTVYMATTADGNSLSQPYVVSIPTNMGEISQFAGDMVQTNNQQRFFEYFTLSSMVLSPFEEGTQSVPTLVFLTQCGDFVFKNWYDIQPGMKEVIERTLANTYMPGKLPTDTAKLETALKYSLTPMNGKNYENLEVSFFLPDEFKLSRQNFGFTPDPINVWARPIPLTGACQSEPVNVNYFVQYPVVVRVKDTLTNNDFFFAFDVAIKDNQPAAWSGISNYDTEELSEICASASCQATVTVEDSSGSPLESAAVNFMGCPAGRTDASGQLTADVPCGIGLLEVHRQGYDVSEQSYSSDTLYDGTTVVLRKSPVINLHLYEVIVDYNSNTQQYWIYPESISPIDNNLRDGAAEIIVFDHTDNEAHDFYYPNSVGRMVGVPSGTHHISALLYSMGSSIPEPVGLIATDYSFTESLDGRDLFVYLPYFPDLPTDGGIETSRSAINLANVLKQCGLGPISASQESLSQACVLAKSAGDIV